MVGKYPYFQEKICFQGSEILFPHFHLFLFSIIFQAQPRHFRRPPLDLHLADLSPPSSTLLPLLRGWTQTLLLLAIEGIFAAATGEGIFATTTADSWKIGTDAAWKIVSPDVGSKSDAADWRIDTLITRLLTPIVSPLLLFVLPSI